ncbi:MAG: hypothetical protein ACRETU_03495, partial [Steroidobacterales bacterium]
MIPAVVLAAAIFSMPSHAEPSLLVVGPAESTDVQSASVVVLGQRIGLTSKTKLIVSGANSSSTMVTAGAHAIRLVESGRMVAIWTEDGFTASAVFISNERSTPGASLLYLNGTVSYVNLSTGRAAIGATQIDLTSALFSGALELAVGDSLQVTGTQPNPRGLVVANSYAVIHLSGIGGTSVNGIGGTSVSGIGGTSVSGIGGTSV